MGVRRELKSQLWKRYNYDCIKIKMFNGIIYNQGIVTKIIKRPEGINIFIKSQTLRLSRERYWCYL